MPLARAVSTARRSTRVEVAHADDGRAYWSKPPPFRYESYWEFPPAHWDDVDKDNATGNQKILAAALADGTLVGRYGMICRTIFASQLEA
jgi:hypothetical protein